MPHALVPDGQQPPLPVAVPSQHLPVAGSVLLVLQLGVLLYV